MRSWLSLAFSKKGPPSDAELYSNLDASFLAYAEYLTAYFHDSENPFTFEKLTEEDFQATYRYILDAALSSLNHPRREVFSKEMVAKIAEEFKARNSDVLSDSYLPPVMPQKYCGWIQGLLNKEFPINKDIADMNIDVLGYLISQAFMQGNPPRNYEQLSPFEEKLIVILAGATFMGFREASAIKDFRQHSNRHLAQIVALTHILGIRFSVENNLK